MAFNSHSESGLKNSLVLFCPRDFNKVKENTIA